MQREPKRGEIYWLYWEVDKDKWLADNNHYLIDNDLYVIAEKSNEVIILDINSGKIKERVNTEIFKKSIKTIDYPQNKVEFIPVEKRETLPSSAKGIVFRKALAVALNIEVVSRDGNKDYEKYYYKVWIKAKIDKNGKCLGATVITREHVLTENANKLSKQIENFIKTTDFKIDSLPYDLNYWYFEDDFDVARLPADIAKRDLKEYRRKVCLIDTFNGEYIPIDLEDAHKQLDKILDDSTKIAVKNGEDSHFGIGLWMRNNWGLWAGTRFSCYFRKKGLKHPDYISGYIIETYQLKLNNQKFDQDSILKKYIQR